MRVLQETLLEGWSVDRRQWGNQWGRRVECVLFPPDADPQQGFSTSPIQLYIQRYRVGGGIDLRFLTQFSVTDFLTLASRFMNETRGVEAISRHQMLLEILIRGKAGKKALQAARDMEGKIIGYDNGIYVFNHEDETISQDDPDCLEFKVSELPQEGEQLDPGALATMIQKKYHGQKLEDSDIVVATESSVLSFSSNFDGHGGAKIFVHTPPELTEAALSCLHSAAVLPVHDLPLDYIDRVVRGQ